MLACCCLVSGSVPSATAGSADATGPAPRWTHSHRLDVRHHCKQLFVAVTLVRHILGVSAMNYTA